MSWDKFRKKITNCSVFQTVGVDDIDFVDFLFIFEKLDIVVWLVVVCFVELNC